MLRIDLRPASALGVLLILMAAGVRPAHAQAEGLTITAEAGLDGYCKQGAWMPVRVTVANDGEDIEGELFATTDGSSQIWRFNVDVSIPSVSRKEWTLYVYPLDGEDEISIGLWSDDALVFQEAVRVNCVDPGDVLMGVWASNPSVFNSQTAIGSFSPRPDLVLIGPDDLPERPLGLEMLDTLTISDVDTGSLSEAQVNALIAWVAGGGRLVIAGGPGWQKTASGLASLLPLVPAGTQSLESLEALAVHAQRDDALTGIVVAATGAVAEEAKVIVEQGGVPLIVSRRHGYGEILYFAVDPGLEPLRSWAGMADLYTALLGRRLDAPSWRDGFISWNEADAALNAIPGLGLPSAWLICGVILCYIGLVGPVNFFVLRQLKKRELAWVTIPIIVLCFSGAIFVSGTNLIGSRPIVNRLSIVQVWPGEPRARIDALIGVFSPARDRFTLSVESSFSAHPIPQPGFSADLDSETVFQTDTGFEIREIEVGTGGLAGYVVAGEIETPRFDAELVVERLASGSRRLSGLVTNVSGLRLADALVLTTSGATPIGDFDPGDSFPVNILFGGGAAVPSGPPAVISGPGSLDDTLIEVFGTSYIYATNSGDIEDVRRFNLLSAAFDPVLGNRGGGVFLLGWTQSAPFDTDLGGGQERNSDSTLYIVHLLPEERTPVQAAGSFVLTPDLFAWSVYGTATGSSVPGPYDSSVSSGAFALSFVPIDRVQFSEVTALTLHLESYGRTGSVIFDVSLWDFETGDWETQPAIAYGDNPIETPGVFVGQDGEIRVRFNYPGTNRNDIERADFTLELLP